MPDTSELSMTALRALRLIGQSGSMSLAAQALHITQSGVSRAVANLERQSGLILVARDARPLSLTRDGEALVARVDRLLAGDAEALAGEGWFVLRHALGLGSPSSVS